MGAFSHLISYKRAEGHGTNVDIDAKFVLGKTAAEKTIGTGSLIEVYRRDHLRGETSCGLWWGGLS